jgi:superfamily II DNA helicase RecQ
MSLITREASSPSSLPFPNLFLQYREANIIRASNTFQAISSSFSLVYYSDFKLVLCSICKSAVTNISFHFKSHVEVQKAEKKRLIKLISEVLPSLTLSSLEDSYKLILKFKEEFPLVLIPFKELFIIPIFMCNICFICLISKPNIIRHLKENHLINKDLTSLSYKELKGQGLSKQRFFFSIIEPISNIDSIIEDKEPSLEVEDPSLASLKLAYLDTADRSLNQAILSNTTLNSKEKLTPFQNKTRYIEYITKFVSKDLVPLVAPLGEGEEVFKLISINLEELLYLSLEKTTFLAKIHLNLLSSFELNKVRNKGFQPLLSGGTRVKYFRLFTSFLVYILRSFSLGFSLMGKDLFHANSKIKGLLTKLIAVATLKLEKEAITSQRSTLKSIKKSFNTKVNRLKIGSLIRTKEGEKVDEVSDFSTNSNSSSNSINSYIGSSSSSSSSSSSGSSSSSNSRISKEKSHTEKDILETIKDINQSMNLLSLEIKAILVELLIAIFKEKIDLYIFNSPINTFFATKSIREKDLSIRGSLELSQLYSHFIYCSQLIVVEFSFRSLLEDPSLDLTTIIKEFITTHFNNSINNGLGEVLLNRSYAYKVNKELSSSSIVTIHATKANTLSYKSITINIEDLQKLFREVINKATLLVHEDLLFNISKHLYQDITLEAFASYEDRSIKTPSVCFRDFHPNSKNHSRFLLKYLLNNRSLFSAFFSISPTQGLILNKAKVALYLKKVSEFKRLCLLLVYFTSGLPLRGTELVTLRFLNSYKDLRELFLDQSGSNLFILNISYYKSQGLRSSQGSNIRYLPFEVSTLFLLYIVLIDPLVNHFHKELLSPTELERDNPLFAYYFYINKRLLDSRDLRLTLNSFSLSILGQRIGIQTYRQLIIAIIRDFMLEKLDLDSLTLVAEESSLSKLAATQMNHSTKVEELNYARTTSTFSNTRSSLQLVYLSFCLRFFRFFKLDIPNSTPFLSTISLRNRELEENTLSISNSLAIKYSKGPSTTSSFEPNNRKHLRQVSSISSSLVTNRVLKKVKTLDLIGLSSLTSSSSLLEGLLQDFLGNNLAIFKIAEQRLLLEAILLKIPYILGILPTSSGKSLTYLLTSALSTSTATIVIAPLVALKVDLLRRAKEFNIPCSIYEESYEVKALTLVSIESIRSSSFIATIKSLIASNKLDRIILDECHLLITSKSYRSIMYSFKQALFLFPIQFVFLTGTLPKALELELISFLSINTLTTIRGICTRDNISFRTKVITSFNTRFLIAQRYISSFKAKEYTSNKDKCLIFCPSIKEAKDLASFLDCALYTSNSSDLEKEATLRGFSESGLEYFSILIATSALEEGFDYSSIRLVIYFQFCYSFLGFLQGSSRGGRDNSPSTSLFLYTKGEEVEREGEPIDKALFRAYLRERTCRKRVISLYLDSKPIDSCALSLIKCDLCFNRAKTIETQGSIILEANKAIALKRASIISTLTTSIKECIACTIFSSIASKKGSIIEPFMPTSHEANSCPIYATKYKFAGYLPKSQFQPYYKELKSDSCCFTCLLPTVICTSIREEEGKCLRLKISFVLIVLLYSYPLALDTCILLNISGPKPSLTKVMTAYIKKVYIEEIATEGLLGFQALLIDN